MVRSVLSLGPGLGPRDLGRQDKDVPPSDMGLRARPGPTGCPGAGWLSRHLPAPRPTADSQQALDARAALMAL